MVDLNLDEEYISYHEKYTICNLSESESDSDSESFIIEALDSSNELQSDYYFIVDNNPNKIHNDIKRTYGNLAAITWKKLNRKKILSKLNYINLRRNFYKNIYQDFSKLIYKVLSVVPANKVKNYEKLLVFIDCLPKLSKMNKILRNGENVINNKDAVFMKLVLDMYGHFYKHLDYPLYQEYRNVFLNACIKFYSKTPESMTKIWKKNLLICNNFFTKNYPILIMETKEEYIQHYKSNKDDYNNLSGGLHYTSFIQ